MSLSAVCGTVSSLKTCQADIGTGMDIVTDVAMDLVEAQGTISLNSSLVSLVLSSMFYHSALVISGFSRFQLGSKKHAL